MSLTTAEKLQAISSPWANYITHLEKTHVTIDGGLVDVITFDDTRGRAFQNVAQLVYCCEGLPSTQRIPSAAKLEKWLTAPDEHPTALFRDAMGAVLDRLWELARSTEYDAAFRLKAKVSPVEFVFIGACALPIIKILKKKKTLNYYSFFSPQKVCCSSRCVMDIRLRNSPELSWSSVVIFARPTSTFGSMLASRRIAGA